MTKTKKEPFLRIVRRNDVSQGKKFLFKLYCVLGAVVISLLFLWAAGGKNPFLAVRYIFEGTFYQNDDGVLDTSRIWSFLKEVVLLLAVSVALTPAYKMKFWNIGAQGQILVGALAYACFMTYLPPYLPNWALILLGFVAALLAGGLWAYLPAIFKARWNTNETLFTLMMNYVAILLVSLFVNLWRGKKSALGIINGFNNEGWLFTIDYTVHGNRVQNAVLFPLILVFLLTVLMFLYLKFTKHGYEIQVVGDSVSTARYTGINVRHVIRRTLFLSGALCGFVGFLYVSNFSHTLSTTLDNGYGFTAIIVCWLSGFNPFVMIGYSALIVFLNKGALNLQDCGFSANLNSYSAQFVIFVIILSLMLGNFFAEYRILFRGSARKRSRLLTEGLALPAAKEDK